LIIECKQQKDTAWIFDKRAKRRIDWDNKRDAMMYCGDSVMSQGTNMWDDGVFGSLGQASHQCPENFENLSMSGNTYIERGGGKMGNYPDLLYKGSNQVINALLDLNLRFGLRGKNLPFLFWRNYPVLVFNGSMYYALLDNKGKLKLEDTKYIQYFQRRTKRGYWIDVVRADFLKKYLTYINHEFEESKMILDRIIEKERDLV
jgi:hypothetical protein